MPFLLTAQGTVACSADGAHLAHEPMGTSSVLRFEKDGDRLRAAPGEGGRSFAVLPALRLLSSGGGRCGLGANGLALTAERDGRLRLGDDPASPDAQFVVIGDEDFRQLRRLHEERYVSSLHGRALDIGEIRLEPGFRLMWGDASTDLADYLSEVERTPSGLTFCYDGWKIETLRPYRPLIYFCAFGAEGIFSCLALACRSLLEIGRYDGEIAVITGAPPEHIEALLHFVPRDRLRILQLEAFDLLDYTHARFRIEELPDIGSYGPILYMDTDIICNRPTRHVLGALLQKRGLCCASELAFDTSDEFYGRGLFFEDPTPVPDNLGISSGFFGGADIDALKDVCRCVLKSSYGLAKARGTRRFFTYMDQPIFNYVVRKLNNFDLRLTDYVVALVGSLTGPHDGCEKRGFLHFCGGVGNSWPKLVAMELYLEFLRSTCGTD